MGGGGPESHCPLLHPERGHYPDQGRADGHRAGPRLRPRNGGVLLPEGGRVTIGSDQLDAWGKTLIEADELYRELQLLIRINPEAYNVDSTALAAVGVANADAYDDGGMDHPI